MDEMKETENLHLPVHRLNSARKELPNQARPGGIVNLHVNLHFDAYNRFTICRKFLMLSKAQIIVGGRVAAKKLGSVIDCKCETPLLEPELIDVTVMCSHSH